MMDAVVLIVVVMYVLLPIAGLNLWWQLIL